MKASFLTLFSLLCFVPLRELPEQPIENIEAKSDTPWIILEKALGQVGLKEERRELKLHDKKTYFSVFSGLPFLQSKNINYTAITSDSSEKELYNIDWAIDNSGCCLIGLNHMDEMGYRSQRVILILSRGNGVYWVYNYDNHETVAVTPNALFELWDGDLLIIWGNEEALKKALKH